ncbi:MAG: metallophosphoesterase [Bacillota bacterium]
MDFKFVHAADLHLDGPFSGLKHQLPRDMTTVAVNASLDALDALADLCVTESVDFLLLAGDIFDISSPSLRAQVRFRDTLRRLADAGIKTFRVTGNHDPIDGSWADLTFPGLTHLFGDTFENVELQLEETVVEVFGFSHPTTQYSRDPLRHVNWPEVSADVFRIGLLHTDLDGSSEDHYAPTTLRELAASGFNYWALGHLHHPWVVRSEKPAVVYAGTPQGRDFGETGAHGCFLVTVKDGVPHPSFRPLDTVRWLDLAVEVTPDFADENALLELTISSLRDLGTSLGGRSAVLRIEYTGQSPLGPRMDDFVAQRDLLETLRDSLPASPTMWLDSIVWEVHPEMDRGALMDREDLPGDIRRAKQVMMRAMNDPGVARAADRDGLREALEDIFTAEPRLGRWVGRDAGRGHIPNLLEDAEDILLRLLVEEGMQ